MLGLCKLWVPDMTPKYENFTSECISVAKCLCISLTGIFLHNMCTIVVYFAVIPTRAATIYRYLRHDVNGFEMYVMVAKPHWYALYFYLRTQQLTWSSFLWNLKPQNVQNWVPCPLCRDILSYRDIYLHDKWHRIWSCHGSTNSYLISLLFAILLSPYHVF